MHDFELLVFIIWIAGTTIKDVIDSKISLIINLQKKAKTFLSNIVVEITESYIIWYFDRFWPKFREINKTTKNMSFNFTKYF